MKRVICPYLGLKDDPTTTLSFPSEGNFCHHAHPIAPVKRSYQARYCLAEAHTTCPVYLASQPMPLPANIAETGLTQQNKRVLAIAAIPVIIALIALVIMLWPVLAARKMADGRIPNSGKENNTGGLGSWLFGPTQTSSTNELLSPQILPTRVNCPMPEGWTTYIVNPTDSLYRLSVIYGVSVETFQQLNCMGNSTAILPGQIIYVPFVPTNTPFLSDATGTPAFRRTGFSPTPTNRPGSTQLPPLLASSTPALTSTLEATITLIPTSIFATPKPTITLFAPPTLTLPPTSTPIPTDTLIPPTETKKPTKTPKPTNTVEPSNTPQPLPTSTDIPPLPTDTPALIIIATDTPIPPVTEKPTKTPKPTRD